MPPVCLLYDLQNVFESMSSKPLQILNNDIISPRSFLVSSVAKLNTGEA